MGIPPFLHYSSLLTTGASIPAISISPPKLKVITNDEGRSFQQLTMKMVISESASIAYIYKLYDGDYMLDFDMQLKGLDQYRTDRMEFKC